MHTAENPTLEILVLMLLIATGVAILMRRFRLPYTVGLVMAGLLLGLVRAAGPDIMPESVNNLLALVQKLPGEYIIGLLVTPLVFEAAFHISWDDLRRDWGLIIALAVPGVAITTVLVGVLIAWGTSFSLAYALVFGALMAATDPVAVVALFRSLGVPKRLQVLMEGESLFNDGTAIVLFTLILEMAARPNLEGGVYSQVVSGLAQFAAVAGGGLGVGLVLGFLVSEMVRRIDDHLIETTLTTLLAFGSYWAASQMGLSGVLAVVAAGLVNGNIGPRGMSPTTRIVVHNFWEYAAFVSNSLVFLLIGLEVNLFNLVAYLGPILLAIGAVLLARVILINGLIWLKQDMPRKWSLVLMWGGLRGAISLALALNLREPLGESGAALQAMAFGVVLFTILVQGFTMQFLLRRMRLVERSEMQEEYERRHARAFAAQAAYHHLRRQYQEGLFSNHTWGLLSPLLEEHSRTLADDVKEVLQLDPAVEAEELDTARREGLRAQRTALLNLMKDGIISEEIYEQLVRGIDVELTGNRSSWGDLIKLNALSEPIGLLMTVVIQIQDVEKAISGLNEAGFDVTRLSSMGGFLGRRNVTLMVGLPSGREGQVAQILSNTCRRRVEYVAMPIDGGPLPLPISTPVTVGGATVFTFQVERYEVF